MLNLKIDQEFKNKIPRLSEKEYEQLEENILSEGEIREPIIVWNDTIVDGHNRWEIYSKHMDVLPEPKTKSMDFSDKWDAFIWMFKNQLGRRNLTDEQRDYLIGKQYEAEKHTYGASDGFRGNQHENVVSVQNAQLAKPFSQETSQKIGKEYGINEATVRRNEMFAKSVDMADEVVPGFKETVLSGNAFATKKEIRHLKQLDVEEMTKKVEEIMERKEKPKREKTEKNEDLAKIKKNIEDSGRYEGPIFTGKNIVDEIIGSFNIAREAIEYSINTRKELVDEYVIEKVGEELERFYREEKEFIYGNR